MSRADLVDMLEPLGIPYAHIEWPDDAELPLPCIVYACGGSTYFSASCESRAVFDRWGVVYYSVTADDAALDAIEGALSRGRVKRGETYPMSIGGTRVLATEFTLNLPR